MDLTTSILIKLFFAIVLVFFFARYFGQFLHAVVNSLFKPKEQPRDIDSLIREKTFSIKSKYENVKKITTTESQTLKNAIQDRVSKTLQIEGSIPDDLEKFSELIKCMEWGDNAALKQLVIKFSDNKDIIIEQSSIKRALTSILKTTTISENFLEGKLQYEELINYVKEFAQIDSLLAVVTTNTKILFSNLHGVSHTDLKSVILEFLNHKHLLDKKGNLPKYDLLSMFIIENKISFNELIKYVRESLELLTLCRPLPDAKQMSQEEIINFFFRDSDNNHKEDVQKAYKRLAKQFHPDKHLHKKISPERQKTIKENYQKIQAYYARIKDIKSE